MSIPSTPTSSTFELAPTEDQAGFYDRFLGHFLAQRGNQRCREAIEWAKRWVHPGYRVLEVGCGIGDLAAALGDAGADVLAVDLSPAVIAWANENHQAPGVTYLCADVRSMPLRGEFDMVVFSDSIEHIPAADRAAVVRKVGAACRTERAVALVAWPNPCVHSRATQSTYQPVDERVEVDQLLAEFRGAGFNFVNYVQSCLGGGYMKAVLQRVREDRED